LVEELEILRDSIALRVSYNGIIPAFQAGNLKNIKENLTRTLTKPYNNTSYPEQIRTRSGQNPEKKLAASEHQFSAENIPLQQCEGFFFGLLSGSGLNPDLKRLAAMAIYIP
tara:strand:- start:48 stop:383 length:336 start_codon:yes stop_codon:yes gene_type:complete